MYASMCLYKHVYGWCACKQRTNCPAVSHGVWASRMVDEGGMVCWLVLTSTSAAPVCLLQWPHPMEAGVCTEFVRISNRACGVVWYYGTCTTLHQLVCGCVHPRLSTTALHQPTVACMWPSLSAWSVLTSMQASLCCILFVWRLCVYRALGHGYNSSSFLVLWPDGKPNLWALVLRVPKQLTRKPCPTTIHQQAVEWGHGCTCPHTLALFYTFLCAAVCAGACMGPNSVCTVGLLACIVGCVGTCR